MWRGYTEVESSWYHLLAWWWCWGAQHWGTGSSAGSESPLCVHILCHDGWKLCSGVFRNYLVLKCHTLSAVVFRDMTFIFLEHIRPTMLTFLYHGPAMLSVNKDTFPNLKLFLQNKHGKYKPWGMEDSLVHSSPLQNSLALASRSS